MILNELTGIKKYSQIIKSLENNDHNITIQNIKNLIQNLGFQFINQGQFSTIFKTKKYVIKIFYDDPAYITYINLLNSIPTKYKKFTPKINDIKSFLHNTNIKFVKLPYYQNLNTNQTNQIRLITYIIHDANHNNNYPKNFLKHKSKNINQIIKIIQNNNFFNRYKFLINHINDLKHIDINLFNFIKYINNIMPKEFYSDLHIKNFMFDNNTKNIILIDPWTNKSILNQ